MYLLDTNVISEFVRPKPNARCIEWCRSKPPSSFFLSAITIGEIQRGIEKQRKPRPRRAQKLEAWLDDLLHTYRERILPLDTASAREWGRFVQALGHSGADLQIAAIASVRGLTVVTRNTRHFIRTGVSVLDPFE